MEYFYAVSDQRKNISEELDMKKEDVVIVGVDPGKHNLVYMTTETADAEKKRKSGKSLRYTSAQRRHESHKLLRRKKLEKAKPTGVRSAEEKLSTVASRVSS